MTRRKLTNGRVRELSAARARAVIARICRDQWVSPDAIQRVLRACNHRYHVELPRGWQYVGLFRGRLAVDNWNNFMPENEMARLGESLRRAAKKSGLAVEMFLLNQQLDALK